MSDNENVEHGPDEACPLPPGQCVYHTARATKVRTVEIDGERYVSADDLSTWLVRIADLDAAMRRSQVNPALLRIAEPAIINHHLGVFEAAGYVLGMTEARIADRLDDEDAYLITPEAMKAVPDTIPDGWLHHEA